MGSGDQWTGMAPLLLVSNLQQVKRHLERTSKVRLLIRGAGAAALHSCVRFLRF